MVNDILGFCKITSDLAFRETDFKLCDENNTYHKRDKVGLAITILKDTIMY